MYFFPYHFPMDYSSGMIHKQNCTRTLEHRWNIQMHTQLTNEHNKTQNNNLYFTDVEGHRAVAELRLLCCISWWPTNGAKENEFFQCLFKVQFFLLLFPHLQSRNTLKFNSFPTLYSLIFFHFSSPISSHSGKWFQTNVIK